MHKILIDRVVDGDTFEARVFLEEYFPLLQTSTQTTLHRRIRLHYIDTPERMGTYLDEEEQLGKAITHLLRLMFTSASELHFEPKLKPDSFGRLLGEVWVTDAGGTFALSEFLLDNGLAKLYELDPQPWWSLEDCIKGLDTCSQLAKNFF